MRLFSTLPNPHFVTDFVLNSKMDDLYWDHGFGEVDTGLVKLESNPVFISSEQDQIHKKSSDPGKTQDSGGRKSPNESSTGQSGTCIVDREKSPVDDSSPCSTPKISSSPICRQFWKAGVYNEELTPVSKSHASVTSRINIHPKFLHSNATSHKWAFGAVAELLDNAVDEIQNKATYVLIDKITNQRNGSPALLIQDDGAGMIPEAMCRCLSFGFSDKKSDSAIGKYGNGFKTSSMRLGADAIVFSRNLVDRTWTQSIGLLSYTFLSQSGYDRIVVPMVHYQFNLETGHFESLQPKSIGHSNSNLLVLLQWSPFSTEDELLQQFELLGYHGTRIIVYNLWLDEEGNMELDFDSDPEDIQIGWDGKSKAKDNSLKAIQENHIANRLRYSLRAYISILYLNLPPTFCIVLRGKVVLYYNIAADLKHPEFISYNSRHEGSVVTTIGFLKEAPDVNIHGFSIYHKRRLILPFLQVVSYKQNRGRGVAGVLEANFIEPTHNKQDFEKTNVYQKLVTRLKEMTNEYWDYHCGLIGYQVPKKLQPTVASHGSSSLAPLTSSSKNVVGSCDSRSAPTVGKINSSSVSHTNPADIDNVELFPCFPQCSEKDSNLKRKLPDQPESSPPEKLMTGTNVVNTESSTADHARIKKLRDLMEINKNLKEKCLENEKTEKEFNLIVMRLKTELGEAKKEYAALLTELQVLEKVKVEANRHIYIT